MARLLALFSLCFALVGCELVADFDRSKIPMSDAGKALPHDAAVAPQADAAMVPIVDAGGDGGAADDDAGN